jgi:hypothetical protein
MEKIEFNVPRGYVLDEENSTKNKVVYKYNDTEEEKKKFFFDIINGMVVHLNEERPDSVVYKTKDGEILFEPNNKSNNLWVSYSKIWSVFKSKFNMEFNEIQRFIKCEVENNLNWKGYTPKKMNTKFGDDGGE